jgi:hypothetical protein
MAVPLILAVAVPPVALADDVAATQHDAAEVRRLCRHRLHERDATDAG